MVSDLFRKDYRQMTAKGVKFTPEDIIRLNALAVKVKLAPNAARDLCLPRLAFLPRDSWFRVPLVLREPTVAHELWLEMVERFIDTSKLDVFLFLHAFALSRAAWKLPDPKRPSRVTKELIRFSTKRLSRFTRDQLKSAVEYALFGDDWTVGEIGGEGAAETRKACASGLGGAPAADTVPSPTIGLLTEARILRLGISTDDAKRMTAAELQEAVNRALALDKKFDAAAMRNAALAAYIRAREEIRTRSSNNQVNHDA